MSKVAVFLLVLCVVQLTLAARIARETPVEVGESIFDSIKKTAGDTWDTVSKKLDEAGDAISDVAKSTAKKLDID